MAVRFYRVNEKNRGFHLIPKTLFRWMNPKVIGSYTFKQYAWMDGVKPINGNCIHCIEAVKTGGETVHCWYIIIVRAEYHLVNNIIQLCHLIYLYPLPCWYSSYVINTCISDWSPIFCHLFDGRAKKIIMIIIIIIKHL